MKRACKQACGSPPAGGVLGTAVVVGAWVVAGVGVNNGVAPTPERHWNVNEDAQFEAGSC